VVTVIMKEYTMVVVSLKQNTIIGVMETADAQCKRYNVITIIHVHSSLFFTPSTSCEVIADSSNHLLTMSAIGHRSDRLPLHTARRAGMRSVMSMVPSRSVRVRSHGTARTVSGVEWSATPATTLMCAPTSLTCEDSVVEAVKGAGASAVDERCVAQEGDVVEAEVPDGGVDHAI